jgi:hypothetical protein
MASWDLPAVSQLRHIPVGAIYRSQARHRLAARIDIVSVGNIIALGDAEIKRCGTALRAPRAHVSNRFFREQLAARGSVRHPKKGNTGADLLLRHSRQQRMGRALPQHVTNQ